MELNLCQMPFSEFQFYRIVLPSNKQNRMGYLYPKDICIPQLFFKHLYKFLAEHYSASIEKQGGAKLGPAQFSLS